CHEIFQNDQRQLKNSFVIKYEEFVADPHKWVNSMYHFLGLSDLPVTQKILSDVNKKYFKIWDRKLSGLFSGAMNRTLVKRYEERVRCFGYSLTDLDWIGPAVE